MRYELQPFPELRATLEMIAGGIPISGSTTVTAQIMRRSDGNFWNGASWQATPFTLTTVPEVTNFPGMYEYLVPGASLDYSAGLAGYIIRMADAPNNIMETIQVMQAPQPWKELRSGYSDVGTFGEGVNVQGLNPGSISSTTFAPGAINAAAIATDAIDADAIAADAIDASALAADAIAEIADGVLDEPMGGHTTGGTLGDFVRRMLGLRQQNNRVVYSAWNTAGVPTAATVYIYASKSDLDADTGGAGIGAIGSYTVAATFDSSLRPTGYTSGKVS